jgi:hypothetical protein
MKGFEVFATADMKTSILWEVFCLLHAGFLFGLLFRPEDGGNISL